MLTHCSQQKWKWSALQALNFFTFSEQFILSLYLNVSPRGGVGFNSFPKKLCVAKHEVFHVILFCQNIMFLDFSPEMYI